MEDNPYEPSKLYENRKSHWHRFLAIPFFGVLGAIPGCFWVLWSLWYAATIPFTENLLNAFAMIGVGGALGGVIGFIGGMSDFIRDRIYYSQHRGDDL